MLSREECIRSKLIIREDGVTPQDSDVVNYLGEGRYQWYYADILRGAIYHNISVKRYIQKMMKKPEGLRELNESEINAVISFIDRELLNTLKARLENEKK